MTDSEHQQLLDMLRQVTEVMSSWQATTLANQIVVAAMIATESKARPDAEAWVSNLKAASKFILDSDKFQFPVTPKAREQIDSLFGVASVIAAMNDHREIN